MYRCTRLTFSLLLTAAAAVAAAACRLRFSVLARQLRIGVRPCSGLDLTPRFCIDFTYIHKARHRHTFALHHWSCCQVPTTGSSTRVTGRRNHAAVAAPAGFPSSPACTTSQVQSPRHRSTCLCRWAGSQQRSHSNTFCWFVLGGRGSRSASPLYFPPRPNMFTYSLRRARCITARPTLGEVR